MLKKQYLFLIIIVCLFAISAVSAEDNSTSDIVSVSNDVNSLEANILESNINTNVNDSDTLKASNDDVLTAGNNWYVNGSKTSSGDGKSDAGAFVTLKEAIDSASDGDTVMIASGEYKGTKNTGLEITKSLNFIKYGDADAIFDAESRRGIWAVTVTSTNITGLTFKNGKYFNEDGSAIYFNSSGSVTNCTFIKNTASSGGAICFSTGGIVTNCTFTDNTGGFGGAIYFGLGRGIVTNCTFTDNTADYGGAIYFGPSGGIVTNCTFTDNTAKSIWGSGGAIHFNSGNGCVTDCIFNNNTAYKIGGAIYFYRDGSVTNCTFTGNIAESQKYNSYGGAIYFYWSGSVTNCTFTDNIASISNGNGGAIHFEYSGSVTDCIFNNNTAYFSGAISFKYSGSVTNCTFAGNKANSRCGGGGAIYFNSGNARVTDCIFNKNTASSGGAIYFVSDGGSVTNSTFTDNTATTKDNAIYFASNSPLVINNSEFINNGNGTDYAIYNSGTLELYNNTVSNGIHNDGLITSQIMAVVCEGGYYTVVCGNVVSLNATLTDDNGNYIYDSSLYFTVWDVNITAVPGIIYTANYTFEESGVINVTMISSKDTNITADVATFNVNPKPKENLTIEATAKPITVGENANVDVAGLEDATGEVTVTVNGKTYTAPIKHSKATVTIPGLTESVTGNVNYGGDDKYNPASTTVKIIVNPKPKENATISINAPAVSEGEDVTVTVILPADATGSVTVGDKVVSVKAGKVVVTLTGLPVGNSVVSVVYSGDVKYNPVETSVNVTVNKKPVPPKENLTIRVTAKPITTGEDATIVVSGLKDATGNMILTVNGKIYSGSIKNGVATVTVPGLTENVTATVSYAGDDKYNSASTTVDIVVNPKPKENATISIDAPEVTEGQNATVTVTLPSDATGTVTATVGGKTYTVPVENGAAIIIIPNLAKGDYTIPVTYSGDNKYNSATKDVTINVKEDTSDKINAPNVTKYYNGPERFVVTVTDYKGNPLANKEVTIEINGLPYTRITDANGIASMAIGLPSNVYNVTVTVSKQIVKSVVTVLSTVDGTDVVKMYKNGTQYYATFVDTKGNLMKNTDVKFNINGVFYTRTTNDKGVAKMNINLPPGTYIITAENPNSKEKYTNVIKVLPSIVENYDLTKYYKNASKYTLRIIGDDGNPVGEGVIVKLNINGVFYERKTNATGYMNMNINLPPGTYTVTAEYNGLRASNKITVLSVLETYDLVMKYHDGSQFKVKVLDGQGRPYAGQTVTYNINGVFYTKTTDGDGIAALTINLPAGEYIITSMYNGLNVANKVTVIG